MYPVFYIKSPERTSTVTIALLACMLGLIVAFSAVTVSCSDAEKEPADKRSDSSKNAIFNDPKYADWQFYDCGQVKLFHPPHHLQMEQFPDRCNLYNQSITRMSQLLGMTRPWDTLVVFVYTGFGQGRELTGQEYPFTQDSIIHFWLPSFIGPTLTDWLIPHWVPTPPKYPFWIHGLRSLMDFSGQNYHQMTFDLIEKGTFIPLDSLSKDTLIDSNTERKQSAEAASFVAYVLADYGPGTLRKAYTSKLVFREMAMREFNKTVDSLQADWLAFARSYVPDSVLQSYQNVD
ncbi:hypothetical protein KQH82_12215 [bacterium]|nr:hypothetical protein [bacterium]